MAAPTFDQIVTNDGYGKRADPNGGYWERGFMTELIALNTGAAFTESSANLLPANSLIEAVTARITTTITTAVSWAIGDASESERFHLAHATMTAGTVVYGFEHQRPVAVGSPAPQGMVQDSAAKVRITLNANPGAGAVRVVVWYRRFVAPTS